MENQVVFWNDEERGGFGWPEEEEGRVRLERIMKKTNILRSEILNFLNLLNESKFQKASKIPSEAAFYSQTIMILIFEAFLFLIFFILMILKVYYYPSTHLEFIALTFLILGLLINLLIILKKGSLRLAFLIIQKPDRHLSNFRHRLFMHLNDFNKKNTYGLTFKIIENGKGIQLSYTSKQ